MRAAHDSFLSDAESILATAAISGAETAYTVLIGHDGGLNLLADNDWPLDRLAAESGARRAYRVKREGGRVRVDGRAGTRACTVSTEPGVVVARRMLEGPALYCLAPRAGAG